MRLTFSSSFVRDLKKAPADVQVFVKEALEKLAASSISEASASSLRLHPLRPKSRRIWKIDVTSNHSWQISLIKQGDGFELLPLGTHRGMDRLY